MTDPVAFIFALLVVLFTPGPTNTLLATASATLGWHRAVLFIPAELAGYLISISSLLFFFGPSIGESPEVRSALRLGCAAYLVYLTWKLWRAGAANVQDRRSLRFRDVFATTLLNPKGLIFALVIFPVAPPGGVWRYFAMFIVVCITAASAWVSFGTIMRGQAVNRNFTPQIFQRVGAVVLGCFALLLIATGLMA